MCLLPWESPSSAGYVLYADHIRERRLSVLILPDAQNPELLQRFARYTSKCRLTATEPRPTPFMARKGVPVWNLHSISGWTAYLRRDVWVCDTLLRCANRTGVGKCAQESLHVLWLCEFQLRAHISKALHLVLHGSIDGG